MADEDSREFNFADTISSIQVEFVQKMTIVQFIKLLERKHYELKKDKGFNVFPGFTKALSSYTIDLKNYVNNYLYEFKFTFEDRNWM